MAEQWKKKWDGAPNRHETLGDKIRRINAQEDEHKRRMVEDPEYRASKEAEEAKKREAREKRKAKRDAKTLKVQKKHGVFDAVVPIGPDGLRHCPRCDRTDFTKRRLRGTEFAELVGIYGLAAHLAAGKAHMVCDHCAAAYPLTWLSAR